MSSKLVENLAEELVEKLKEDNALDLSNPDKLNEFTDLLYEILDNGIETEKRVDDLDVKTDILGEETDDLRKNVNNLAADIYNYFKQDENTPTADNGNNDDGVNNGLKLKLRTIEVNQNRVLSIVERLQTNVTAQGNDITEIKKELNKKGERDDTKPTSGETPNPLDSSNDEKGSKYHVRTIHYLKSIQGSIHRSEHNLRRDNKRMERSIKSKIQSGFGKWWGRLKKMLLIAAIFIFSPLIKRILGGILEMTEPMWRPFTDWFQKNFPKLTEGIQWVMSAVGDILDFALTLKELYNKYADMDDNKKDAIAAATTVASYTAAGAAVGGVYGAAAGALVGAFMAEINDMNNMADVTKKYEETRNEYKTALENKNITALERKRLEMEMAELDYVYDKKRASFMTRQDYSFGASSIPVPHIPKNYERSDVTRNYQSKKMEYELMRTNPEMFDESGNFKTTGSGSEAFGFTSGFFGSNSGSNGETGATPTIMSSNSFTTVEVTVQPTESPLEIK